MENNTKVEVEVEVEVEDLGFCEYCEKQFIQDDINLLNDLSAVDLYDYGRGTPICITCVKKIFEDMIDEGNTDYDWKKGLDLVNKYLNK